MLLLTCLQALRLMYSNNVTSAALNSNRNISMEVPEPVEYYVTHWAADPLARGSYSYYATGNALNITGECTMHLLVPALSGFLLIQASWLKALNTSDKC